MNYFDHDDDVRFVDGLLENSQNWQWLFDFVNDNYKFEDATSWYKFVSDSNSIRELINRFIKILNICNKEWEIKNSYIQDAWILAKYIRSIIDKKSAIENLKTTTGKMLLLCYWVTKLINKGNKLDTDFDIRVLQETNIFQILNLEFVEDEIEDINKLIDEIKVEGINDVRFIINDNINKKMHQADDVFYAIIFDAIKNNKLFNFSGVRGRRGASWQEELVLDLINLPLAKCSENSLYKNYGKEDIVRAKEDLHNVDVSFILDTVMFHGFDIVPQDECIIKHCNIVSGMIEKNEDLFDILDGYSCETIAKIFDLKLQGDWRKSESFKKMICLLQSFENPEDIRNIRCKKIPISKNQKLLYQVYCESKYKQISDIKILAELSIYLEDKDVIFNIDNEYFKILSRTFDELINCESEAIRIAHSFYDYMLFLITINHENAFVDKRNIQPEMVRIKNLWTQTFFSRAMDAMQVFSHEATISSDEIEKFNNGVLANPITFANLCLPYDENALFKYMLSASNNVIIYMVTRMELSPDFPKKDNGVIFEKHDIDKKFLSIITDIEERKGYKLLNKLEPEKFVAAIYREFKSNTQINVSFFHKEKELYELIKAKTSIELLDYNTNINLAMVTQLFPVLEMQIRELVSLFGIFPYYMSEDDFMKANDPSSLLRELLLQIYDEQKCFDNVSDLLFVYNAMYNSNFLNIRNECIHGRAFYSGGSLRYAFRVTLLCMYMVIFRIESIKNNISALIEYEIHSTDMENNKEEIESLLLDRV